jgi:hypothetical protein
MTPGKLAEEFARDLPDARKNWEASALIAFTELQSSNPALFGKLATMHVNPYTLQHELVRRALFSPAVVMDCFGLDVAQLASAHRTVAEIAEPHVSVGVVLARGLPTPRRVLADELMIDRWTFVIDRLVRQDISDDDMSTILLQLLDTHILDHLPVPLVGIALPKMIEPSRPASPPIRRRGEPA